MKNTEKKRKMTKEDVEEIVTVFDKHGIVDKVRSLPSGKKLALIIAAVCVFVIALVLIIKAIVPNYSAEVSLLTVGTGDVTQTISSTGTVVSNSKTTYKIFDGVTVKEVNVKLGDAVKKGDVLATFDCSKAKGFVTEKKEAYEQAKASYDDTMEAAASAKQTLPELERKIAELEKKIKAAQAEEEKKQSESTTSTTSSLLQNIQKLIENLANLGVNLDMSNLFGSQSGSMQLQVEYVELMTQKATLEVQSNSATQEVYKALMDSAKATYDDYRNAYAQLEKGWVADRDGVVTAINITAGSDFDLKASPSTSQNIDLSTILSAVNGEVDVNQLISNFTSSSITSGIVVDNYDDFEIEFVISKYDIPKVKLGQKATVTALDKEFEGKISYIAPTIEGSAGLDIGSIASSLTGGSSSSSGLNAKIKLDNPDTAVIIGLSVDIEIETDSVTGKTVVPLEAVEIDGSSYYAYVYNPDDKTIEKRELKVGISSDTMYEVVSGCKAGEKLVKNPKSTLVDGSMVKVIKED